LRNLNTIPAVAGLFKAAEADRQAVQEKVAVEMDILYVPSLIRRRTADR